MKRIPLTQGKTALIDDEDAPLAAFRWYAHRNRLAWYVMRRLGRRTSEYLHRVVWARAHPGEPMPRELDHIDGDGLNCRRSNLRAASGAENARNRRLRKDNTSGFKGVSWHRPRAKWVAYIQVAGKNRYLGLFSDRETAARAYDVAAREHYGDFAALNFPRRGERKAA